MKDQRVSREPLNSFLYVYHPMSAAVLSLLPQGLLLTGSYGFNVDHFIEEIVFNKVQEVDESEHASAVIHVALQTTGCVHSV